MLCKMWSRWWINKPCVFWMSSSTSGLGSLKDTIKSSYFPNKLSLHKYGSSIWKVFPQMEDHQFAWILWYIWKGRNNKVFSNLDINPRDTLNLAETESILWAEAQVLNEQRRVPQVEITTLTSIPGRWCFTDGSSKENDIFSGLVEYFRRI